jgi:hypothetical protein
MLLNGIIRFVEKCSCRLGFEPIAQSALLDPVLRVDKSLLIKPIDAAMEDSSPSTVLQSTQDSPRTLEPVTEVPDSVDRVPRGNEKRIEIGSPAALKKVNSFYNKLTVAPSAATAKYKHPNRSI